MAAVVGTNAADRTGATWEGQLAPFTRLEFACSDGAKGIAAAVASRAEARRRDASAPALEHGLDVFHTSREAQRVLAPYWRRAEAAWEQAEAADAVVAEAKRQGIDARLRGLAGTARAEWGGRGRRWSRPSGSKRPGTAPPRRWSSSAPTVGSTTAPPPQPRSPRRWVS